MLNEQQYKKLEINLKEFCVQQCLLAPDVEIAAALRLAHNKLSELISYDVVIKENGLSELFKKIENFICDSCPSCKLNNKQVNAVLQRLTDIKTHLFNTLKNFQSIPVESKGVVGDEKKNDRNRRKKRTKHNIGKPKRTK